MSSDDNASSNRVSLLSLVPPKYIFIGSVVMIGLLNMYKGLFRFSYGFVAGLGIGVAVGFAFADSSVGRYILKQRARPQEL